MVIKNPHYKSQAINSLCNSLLEDTDFDVRCSAAQALGIIGDENAIPVLVKALNDENSLVRQKSAEALGKIANDESIAPLDITTRELIQTIRIMSEQSKSQNFTFNSVNGNVNAGGTVNNQNYSNNDALKDPQFIETLNEIKDLIISLQKNDPSNPPDLKVDIIEAEFKELQRNDLNKWKRWMTWLDIAFAGGLESAKALNPWLGVPVEVVKKLYQVYCESKKGLT